MGLIELLQDRSPPMAAFPLAGRYLLSGRHSPSGGTVDEGHVDLLSVIVRGTELIRLGYAIDIRSPCHARWTPASCRSFQRRGEAQT